MTKKQKELIAEAIHYDGSPIDGIYILSEHKLYNGAWGKNGYNSMIILAYSIENEKIYHFDLNYQRDVFSCLKKVRFSIDIPHEYDCLRLCFYDPVIVRHEQLSTFIVN